MPFEDDVTVAPRGPIGAAPAEIPNVGAGKLAGAVIRNVSPVGSALNALQYGPVGEVDPSYDVVGDLRDTPYWEFRDAFVRSRNAQHTALIKQRIDEEMRDQKTIADAGAGGLVASLAAGLLDPTIVLPGGAIYRSTKGGFSVARSAGSAAAAGAVQGAASETLLQMSQVTRKPEDYLMSVGASALLSGILGGGAATLLSKAERITIERGLEGLRAPREGAAPVAGDLSAAAADARTGKVADFVLNRVPVVGDVVEKVSPTLRVGSSMLQESRRALGDLAVLAYRTVDNAEGIATARGGISVEADVLRVREQMLFNSLSELDRLYREMKFGPEGGNLIERVQDRVGGMVGADTGGMTKAEFNAEVSRAMRRNDQHENPYVQSAAQYFRANVIEPLKQRAVAAGRLPEDVKAKGADSYLMRVYNKGAIEANGPDFVNRTQSWLREEEGVKEAIQARLASLEAQRAEIADQIRKLDARLDRAEIAAGKLEARSSERGMEAGTTDRRATRATEKRGTIAQDISELQEFIAAMRNELRDPETLAQLERLEQGVRDLKREAGPLSDREIKAVTEEEVKSVFSGRFGEAADVFIGRKAMPRGRGFLDLFQERGIFDGGGEVRATIDGARARPPIPGLSRSRKKPAIRPGLLRKEHNRNSLDDWGEILWNDFPEHFSERPTPNDVLELIDEAARGRDPDWWVENYAFAGEAGRGREINEAVADLERTFSDAGMAAPTTRREFVAALNRITGDSVKLTEAINAKLEASGNLSGAQGQLADLKGDRTHIRGAVAQALDERARLAANERVAAATEREATMGASRNARRLGVLNERLALKEEARALMADARASAQRAYDDMMARIESEIGSWNGTSADEAKMALKQREKYLADQEAKAGKPRDPGAPRLTMADDAVGATVRRILKRPVRDDAELRSIAEQIKDRIISTPDGRMPYDGDNVTAGFGGFADDGRIERQGMRGGLAKRSFAIPDALIEDYLENDIERVTRSFVNTFLPDVALTEKFGSVDMTEQFRRIQDEANALERAAATEKERVAIREQAKADIRDLAAMRDRIRNVFGAEFNAKHRGLARAAFLARAWNTVTQLGGAAISSVPDMAAPVLRWGMEGVVGDAWKPFIGGLAGGSDGVKRMREQMRAAGIGVETWSAGRLSSLEEITEAYRPNSRFERGVESATQGFYLLNLQAQWTDLAKHVAGTVASAGLLKAARRVATGAGKADDVARLAENGIEPAMASRIWNEWSRPGAGETIDGVMLPNLDRWADDGARVAFETALMREVNISVVTPGQEKPLWMSNPLLGVLGQFKSFVAGANERLLIAGLQQRDARTLQGVAMMMGAGAISVFFSNLAADRPLPERPQDWVKESMERAGILGWLSEVNQLTAKATSGGVDLYRLIGADKPLTRNAATSAAGMLFGPSYGKLETMFKVTGAPFREEGWTARDTADARRLLPLQNLWALRRLLNEAEDGVNRASGIKPLDRESLQW